jgi:ribose transport system permease protein
LNKLLKKQYLITLVLLSTVIILSVIFVPRILSPENIFIMLRNASIVGILAVGLTFVIITGGIDLSIGSILALGSGICSALLKYYGMSFFPSIVLTLVLVGICGFINGIFITQFKIRPFVATLGSMAIFSSVSLSLSKNIVGFRTIDNFNLIYWGHVGFLSIPTIIWAVLFFAAGFILKYTYFGRYLYALGDSRTALVLMGVNIVRYEILAYSLCGLFAGCAGIIMLSRTSNVMAGDNISLVFDAITAVSLGGISLNGARDRLAGVLLGTLTVVFCSDFMTFLSVDSLFQGAFKGLMFLSAAALDENLRKNFSGLIKG